MEKTWVVTGFYDYKIKSPHGASRKESISSGTTDITLGVSRNDAGAGGESNIAQTAPENKHLLQAPEWTPEKIDNFVRGYLETRDKADLRLAIWSEPLATRVWLVNQFHSHSPEAAALIEPVVRAMYIYGELTGNVFDSRTKGLFMQKKEPITPNGTGRPAETLVKDQVRLMYLYH